MEMIVRISPFALQLGTKLRLVIGAALASMIIISVVALAGLNRIAEDSQSIHEEGFAELTFISNIQIQIEQLEGLVAKTPKETDQRILSEAKERYFAISEELSGSLTDAHAKAVEAATHRIDELEALTSALEEFMKHGAGIFQMAEDGNWYGAENLLKGEAATARKQLDILAGGYVGEVKGEAQDAVSDMKTSIRLITMSVAIAALVLVLLVGGWGSYVITGGMRAINAVTGVTGQLAAGDMDVKIPGGERTDEIGEMARSLEQIRAVGIMAARAQSSLDDASSAMMIVDVNGEVIFPNKAMVSLYEDLVDDLSGELAGFDGSALIGRHFDALHNSDVLASERMMDLSEPVSERMVAGRRTIHLTASPVFNEQGDRLGAVVEWLDMTAQAAVESEIADLVLGASEGDFSRRLTEADKSGFMAVLANGINELLDVVDNGLAQVLRIMAALAEGDLTARMKGKHKGAFGRLKQDADRMGEQMEGIVGRIAEVSGAVQTATDEISSGIADLSARTEHQASSLEETTASMEELSATVRQNSDNAQEANQVAGAAREAAVSGGEVAGRAVAAMGGIEESSRKITEIVGLIQEIAFQTNLLALNASVEAARAGEAGRGFAVVANEVRALAQRAASASKDIKDLITNSGDQVHEGVKLVGEAGGALEEIVASVKKVADFVSEIAAASQEQTSGIDQVSGAINGMDEMTQQNAALVEETTGAIASAAGQVADLQKAVGFFKTAQQMADNPEGLAEKSQLHGMALKMADTPKSSEKPAAADNEDDDAVFEDDWVEL